MKLTDKLKQFKSDTEKQKFLIGKVLKTISDNNGSCIPVGTRVTVTSYSGGNVYFSYLGGAGYSKPASEFDIGTDTIESLEERNKNLEDELHQNRTKIKFMKENSLEEFDETDFKTYAVLEALDDPKLSKIERAKLISKIVKES